MYNAYLRQFTMVNFNNAKVASQARAIPIGPVPFSPGTLVPFFLIPFFPASFTFRLRSILPSFQLLSLKPSSPSHNTPLNITPYPGDRGSSPSHSFIEPTYAKDEVQPSRHA
nr:hypothetical protein Q903MT_gene2850 [Picea sitchensis]